MLKGENLDFIVFSFQKTLLTAVGMTETYVRVPARCSVTAACSLIAREFHRECDADLVIKAQLMTMARNAQTGPAQSWREGLEWHHDDGSIVNSDRRVIAMARGRGG